MGSSHRYRQQATVYHIVQREGDILYHFRPGTPGHIRSRQIRSTVGGRQLDTYPNRERLQSGYPKTTKHITEPGPGYRHEDAGNTSILDLDICSGMGEGSYGSGLRRHERKCSGGPDSKAGPRLGITRGGYTINFVGKSCNTAKLPSGLPEKYLHRGRGISIPPPTSFQ